MTILNPLTIPRGDVRYVRQLQEVECLSGDSVGDVVYVRGDATAGGIWKVGQATNLDRAKMPAVGILVSKITATEGVIRRIGAVEGVFSSLDVTKQVFVGEDGQITQTAPIPALNEKVWVQKLGFAIASDVLWLTGEIGQILTRRG